MLEFGFDFLGVSRSLEFPLGFGITVSEEGYKRM